MGKQTFRTFGEDFNKMPLYSIMLENKIWPDDKFLLSLHKNRVYWSDSSDLTKIELLASAIRELVLGMDRTTIQAGKREKEQRLIGIFGTLREITGHIAEKLVEVRWQE